MPAENEHGPTRESYDGMDALMAALTDAPLSDEARDDPGYLAAHRAATADLALLRDQLTVLADTLTGSEPAPLPESAVRPLRRPVRPAVRALRALAVAAAGAMVVGSGWLLVQTGGGASSSGDSSAAADSADQKAEAGAGGPFGDPAFLACARLVVEGDVTAVEPLPGTGDERVTLRVTRAYKPEETAAEVRFALARDMDPLVAKGDHVLVALDEEGDSPVVWSVGEAGIAAEREALARALPQAEQRSCG
ncbi:hypothetical protein OG616_13740 [Streptomyces antibioticus]|uniref:hypothetical protein n=1 Tax=Streptomyces antibioticus TaxID=1890 RepID=UPI002259A995|nr:hypothetical protein [Streptomyces antibioticus]MCX5169080.1 hypothetical protein [Streptomyces antibioticus]